MAEPLILFFGSVLYKDNDTPDLPIVRKERELLIAKQTTGSFTLIGNKTDKLSREIISRLILEAKKLIIDDPGQYSSLLVLFSGHGVYMNNLLNLCLYEEYITSDEIRDSFKREIGGVGKKWRGIEIFAHDCCRVNGNGINTTSNAGGINSKTGYHGPHEASDRFEIFSNTYGLTSSWDHDGSYLMVELVNSLFSGEFEDTTLNDTLNVIASRVDKKTKGLQRVEVRKTTKRSIFMTEILGNANINVSGSRNDSSSSDSESESESESIAMSSQSNSPSIHSGSDSDIDPVSKPKPPPIPSCNKNMHSENNLNRFRTNNVSTRTLKRKRENDILSESNQRSSNYFATRTPLELRILQSKTINSFECNYINDSDSSDDSDSDSDSCDGWSDAADCDVKDIIERMKTMENSEENLGFDNGSVHSLRTNFNSLSTEEYDENNTNNGNKTHTNITSENTINANNNSNDLFAMNVSSYNGINSSDRINNNNFKPSHTSPLTPRSAHASHTAHTTINTRDSAHIPRMNYSFPQISKKSSDRPSYKRKSKRKPKRKYSSHTTTSPLTPSINVNNNNNVKKPMLLHINNNNNKNNLKRSHTSHTATQAISTMASHPNNLRHTINQAHRTCNTLPNDCNSQFHGRNALNTSNISSIHLKTSKKPYKCRYCNLRYARKSVYEIHLRKHTGEKPYQCDVCYKRFSQISNLNLHKRIHSANPKPYQCDVCRQQFTRKSSLQRHHREKSRCKGAQQN